MLQLLIGFAIAVLIALTGVGAGVVTAPLLILFLHVPVEIAVSTALAYAAVVKLIVVPVQIWRKQVSYRILLWMLLGGIPGVILGSLIFRHVATHGPKALLYIVLGAIIIFSSGWQIFRHFRPDAITRPTTDHPKWIGFITFPIAAEVGFSWGRIVPLVWRSLWWERASTGSVAPTTRLCCGSCASAESLARLPAAGSPPAFPTGSCASRFPCG
jgi:uncharacterized membrane protein YfcA